MAGFCRIELFDLEFFTIIEKIFVNKIEGASGETLVTIFTAHSAWAMHIID